MINWSKTVVVFGGVILSSCGPDRGQLELEIESDLGQVCDIEIVGKTLNAKLESNIAGIWIEDYREAVCEWSLYVINSRIKEGSQLQNIYVELSENDEYGKLSYSVNRSLKEFRELKVDSSALLMSKYLATKITGTQYFTANNNLELIYSRHQKSKILLNPKIQDMTLSNLIYNYFLENDSTELADFHSFFEFLKTFFSQQENSVVWPDAPRLASEIMALKASLNETGHSALIDL